MSGRLALITGASAGIGAAFASLYASQGYDLAITARRADRLNAVADEVRLRYGVEILIVPADLARPDGVDGVLDEIAAHGRVVDVLVNNAGYGLPGSFVAASWDEQQAFLKVLLTSVCELTHKVLPGMLDRRFGRILNVASMAGLAPAGPGTVLYSAAKAFVVKFSQGLHLEARGAGVHVSALVPRLYLHRIPRRRGHAGVDRRNHPALDVDGRGRGRGRGLRGRGGQSPDLRARRALQGGGGALPAAARGLGHGANGPSGQGRCWPLSGGPPRTAAAAS